MALGFSLLSLLASQVGISVMTPPASFLVPYLLSPASFLVPYLSLLFIFQRPCCWKFMGMPRVSMLPVDMLDLGLHGFPFSAWLVLIRTSRSGQLSPAWRNIPAPLLTGSVPSSAFPITWCSPTKFYWSFLLLLCLPTFPMSLWPPFISNTKRLGLANIGYSGRSL